MPCDKYLSFKVIRRQCGQLSVVLGAAPASELIRLSFADVLNEATDQGYQRPIDIRHPREFSAYIENPGATTIPLTFNLRGPEGERLAADGLRPRRLGIPLRAIVTAAEGRLDYRLTAYRVTAPEAIAAAAAPSASTARDR